MRVSKRWVVLGLGAGVVGLAGLLAWPPVNSRVQMAWTQARYALNPPQKAVFVPQATLPAVAISVASFTPAPSATVTGGPTATVGPSPTPTPSPSPIPAAVTLTGAVHEYQQWNNCGPATLSENLSFWGWAGDQRDPAAFLKPNERDRNVSPEELALYVETQTQLKALVRYGLNDLGWLKRLVAAGFPVIVEKGFEIEGEDWMGHYSLITGYSDAREKFITQDVYIMPDFPVPYAEQAEYWRHFNAVFGLVYPPEREPEVKALLGESWDAQTNAELAAQTAQAEIQATTGRDQYFAWFNLGTSLTAARNYAAAAAAYDQAFAIYPDIPEAERPWRMLWYQFGPYEAYYQTGRYTDVVTLAKTTIDYASEPALEDSFYWRGRAKAALGNTAGAAADYRLCLKWHAGHAACVAELTRLGETP